MRTYEFRLYPNREQRRRLDACLLESRQIYNEMLACEKQHYAETGTFLNRYELNKRFAGRGGTYVPATTVQCLSDRLTKALTNFLKYKNHGWGFPRYRSGNQCFRCGELVQKSLSVRTHICPHCGYVADRDVNAAQNILQAGAPPSGTVADGLPVEPRSCC